MFFASCFTYIDSYLIQKMSIETSTETSTEMSTSAKLPSLLQSKRMSMHAEDYYTTYSDVLILAALFFTILYAIALYTIHTKKVEKRFIISSLFSLKGIILFCAINAFAVLIASSQLNNEIEKRYEKPEKREDEETCSACQSEPSESTEMHQDFISLKSIKSLNQNNFNCHVLPVFVALILIFVVFFTNKYSNQYAAYITPNATSTMTSNAVSMCASFVFGFLFIMCYLLVPSKGTPEPNILMSKINAVYLNPSMLSLIIFIIALVLGVVGVNIC